ncbi:MAG TPA: OsmC family protein [Gaiellaceae bacterium]|nr:OsmC family protein [Gaiellaceae bacterium]
MTSLQSPAVRTKSYAFPVTIEWLAGRTVSARVTGKQHVAIGPPVEFGGTDPVVWNPEDLLVASAASCLAVTYTGLAQKRGLHLSSLRVEGEGIVGTRDDQRFGFTEVNLQLRIVVPPPEAELATELAHEAHDRCLVAASLACTVDVEIDVGAAVE